MCVSTQTLSRIPLCSGHGQLGAHSKGNCSLKGEAELRHRNGLEYVSGRKNYYLLLVSWQRLAGKAGTGSVPPALGLGELRWGVGWRGGGLGRVWGWGSGCGLGCAPLIPYQVGGPTG